MYPSETIRPFSFVRRAAFVSLLSCAPMIALHAQQPGLPAADSNVGSGASVLLASTDGPLERPLDLASVAGVTYSSSSTQDVNAVNGLEAERLNLAGVTSEETQPPPRRRYGRPRYNDSSHNPDGSNKYAFLAGIGFTLPTGNTYHYLSTSYGFQVGAGRNFSKKSSLIAQFDWDNFGFNGRTLYNQQALYNYGVSSGSQYYIAALDGNSHIWSFTLNPTFNFYSSEGLGAYVVGGVGFYHKVANFTTPVTGQAYDYFYGPYQYTANETIDHYTSNAPGFSGGFGLTYKPSRFANERFYAEARYVFVDNQQRTGLTVSNVNTAFGATYTGYNYYPANSNRSTYIPIKIGIRF